MPLALKKQTAASVEQVGSKGLPASGCPAKQELYINMQLISVEGVKNLVSMGNDFS